MSADRDPGFALCRCRKRTQATCFLLQRSSPAAFSTAQMNAMRPDPLRSSSLIPVHTRSCSNSMKPGSQIPLWQQSAGWILWSPAANLDRRSLLCKVDANKHNSISGVKPNPISNFRQNQTKTSQWRSRRSRSDLQRRERTPLLLRSRPEAIRAHLQSICNRRSFARILLRKSNLICGRPKIKSDLIRNSDSLLSNPSIGTQHNPSPKKP